MKFTAEDFCNQNAQYILGVIHSSLSVLGLLERVTFDKDTLCIEVADCGISMIPGYVEKKTLGGNREFPCWKLCQEYRVDATHEEPEDGGVTEIGAYQNPIDAAQAFCTGVATAKVKQHFNCVRDNAAAHAWEQNIM